MCLSENNAKHVTPTCLLIHTKHWLCDTLPTFSFVDTGSGVPCIATSIPCIGLCRWSHNTIRSYFESSAYLANTQAPRSSGRTRPMRLHEGSPSPSSPASQRSNLHPTSTQAGGARRRAVCPMRRDAEVFAVLHVRARPLSLGCSGLHDCQIVPVEQHCWCVRGPDVWWRWAVRHVCHGDGGRRMRETSRRRPTWVKLRANAASSSGGSVRKAADRLVRASASGGRSGVGGRQDDVMISFIHSSRLC